MSEIEKMYKNARIEQKYCNKVCEANKYPYQGWCKGCKYLSIKYPQFTAEKQIELIKLLQRKNGYKFSFSSTNDNSEYLFFALKDNTPVQDLIVAGDKCYEEALASFINTLWQSLTEKEKRQITDILK